MILWVNGKNQNWHGAGGYKIETVEEAVNFIIDKLIPFEDYVFFLVDDNDNTVVSKQKLKRLVREQIAKHNRAS